MTLLCLLSGKRRCFPNATRSYLKITFYEIFYDRFNAIFIRFVDMNSQNAHNIK